MRRSKLRGTSGTGADDLQAVMPRGEHLGEHSFTRSGKAGDDDELSIHGSLLS